MTGSLFQIPTFGFYRFWLITKLRRHLWSNTQVEGEAFEYTGTAGELLIGALIALAVLTPIYIMYFFLGIILEEAQVLASLPLILILYVLMHFASYRARRYRATRTIFRGIRFWMKGKGWAYAMRAILWDIATVLTLGLALPWAMASLERYRMKNTYFGTIQGGFSGTGWELFKRGFWVWALGMAIIFGPGLIMLAVDHVTGGAIEEMFEGELSLWANLTPFLLILTPLALWPLAMAIFTRWQMEGLRFGDVTVSSNLRKGTFYGVFFRLIFSSIGFLLVFAVLGGIGALFFEEFFLSAFAAMKTQDFTSNAITMISLIAVAYLALLLGMGIIQRYFLGRGMWAAIVTSITVSNLRSLDAAVAAGQPSGVLGEGLADALDFSVGI